MAVYAGRQWAFVEEHIHDTLGKQLVAAGEGPAALPHFLAQLPCPFNSPDWQQYYLEQFLGTLRDVQAEQVRNGVVYCLMGDSLVAALPGSTTGSSPAATLSQMEADTLQVQSFEC